MPHHIDHLTIRHMFKWKPIVAAVLLFPALFTSCREDDPVPARVPDEGNQYVNSWILENMQFWYLWNDQLPDATDKNQDPKTYFESLLYKEDRFSWIQDDYTELLRSLQGISQEPGYEYALYREKPGSNNVVLQILYVKPHSPAEAAGLKRGDVVTHINGQTITIANYSDLLEALKRDHTVRYRPVITEEQQFGEARTINVSSVVYAEDPNFLHKVIDVGEKRIGYFVYNFFASGTDDQPEKYDAETTAIFADFKAAGITDLIIDLRYNSGGSETAARNLASLIGAGIDDTKVFAKRRYNPTVQEAILNDENLGADYLISYFENKASNIGDILASDRVYILTSSRTASASELVINALKPFMDVFLIGETTYGKNVGSITLYEADDPENRWGIQPIVVKVFNAQDQSDYSTGFVPDVTDADNGRFLFPLGDPREALLAQAIGQITGTGTIARRETEDRTPVSYSLDLKRRSFSLIMDGIPGQR